MEKPVSIRDISPANRKNQSWLNDIGCMFLQSYHMVILKHAGPLGVEMPNRHFDIKITSLDGDMPELQYNQCAALVWQPK